MELAILVSYSHKNYILATKSFQKFFFLILNSYLNWYVDKNLLNRFLDLIKPNLLCLAWAAAWALVTTLWKSATIVVDIWLPSSSAGRFRSKPRRSKWSLLLAVGSPTYINGCRSRRFSPMGWASSNPTCALIKPVSDCIFTEYFRNGNIYLLWKQK